MANKKKSKTSENHPVQDPPEINQTEISKHDVFSRGSNNNESSPFGESIIASDSTAVEEMSAMLTENFSKNIIESVKNDYNLKKLQQKKGDLSQYLKEGQYQIDAIWNGIHALNIHTEMFTVLFLIAMGNVLNEIKSGFDQPHQFSKWRDEQFDFRHRRLFQQAQQLASMGGFAKKFSPLGKTRLLQLESIRKTEEIDSCETLLQACPVYEEISEKTLSDEIVEKMDVDPFPDISHDLDNHTVKQYVNSFITFHRLKKAGITYADFDHATLISEYLKRTILVQEVEMIKKELEKHEAEKHPELFDNYIMDRMKSLGTTELKKKSPLSINKLVTDLLKYFENNNIETELDSWWEKQRDVVDKDILERGYNFLGFVISKFQPENPD